ncbi:hypothetical protein BJ912DRAFT_950728 [Pholiota molesta]|nr:hypothetical protein BJ912DRAFT_950728 [Pholiota molesta]
MLSKRDSEFPVTSIGRSSGARLQQASAAHEAHPLLSPGPSLSPTSDEAVAVASSGGGATLSTAGGPRYVPYTPRQRVSATSATTGTTVHPPSPQQHQGDATSKLQVMHLKAAAQSIGLDSGTLGWSILEKLVLDPEVWSAITSGKVRKVTADFVKDHVILCDSPLRKDAPIVTLSGLRGTLDIETLIFRSTINPTSKFFQDILNPTTRSSALLLLPPLPGSLPDTIPSIYPQYNIPSYTPSLHLPPRPKQSQSLPSHLAQQTFRLGPRWVGPYRRARKGDEQGSSAEIKAALANASSSGSVPIPSWVAERIHDITADWYPFIKNPTVSLQKRLANTHDKSGKDHGNGYLEPFIPRSKDRDPDSDVEDEKDREKRESDRMESETRIREVMEAVERMITSLFYDRLFMQPTTDDASHDEALSSRVAALNLLDLGLGHLGIEVPDSINEAELNAVVKACGDMLTQLDYCHSPADKSAILVAAHKIVVDGLSRLPPIRLISEDETARDDDGLLTAKPKDNPTDFNNHPSASNAPEDLSEAEAPTESSSQSSVTSLQKPPPPSLLLEPPTPHPSSESFPNTTAHLEVSSTPKNPTPVSGDVLLPLIIFSVVKTNPPHLVSNLLFTQRFRNQSVGGEESYCLINLLAVAEFLETDKVMSTADLTPIPLTRSPVTADTPLEAADQGLRGRVGQQVDAITDSANKVITGVVDSSFGILRSFMPSSNVVSPGVASAPGTPGMRPGFGLLRRESGFSIASLAASLPITGRSRSNTAVEESGQQLLTVSRPSSVRSRSSRKSLNQDEESDAAEESSATNDEESGSDGDEEDEDDSMLSASKPKSKSARARKSLSDRLASVSALAHMKGAESSSHRASLLQPGSLPMTRPGGGSPYSSRAASPALPSPPLRWRRRISEIGDLLREYRRLVEGIRSVGGFEE